jgi:hypothetical protein
VDRDDLPSYRQALALVGTPHTDSEGSRMIAAQRSRRPPAGPATQVPKDRRSRPKSCRCSSAPTCAGHRDRAGRRPENAARDAGRDAIMGVT